MPDSLPAGIPASITETFPQPAEFVGALVWSRSGGVNTPITNLPGMVNGVLPAQNVSDNMWVVDIPGSPGLYYLAQISAYTDDTYETIDDEQPQGDKSFIFESSGGGAGLNGIVGYIDSVLDVSC